VLGLVGPGGTVPPVPSRAPALGRIEVTAYRLGEAWFGGMLRVRFDVTLRVRFDVTLRVRFDVTLRVRFDVTLRVRFDSAHAHH
jgi:hypothetical protein